MTATFLMGMSRHNFLHGILERLILVFLYVFAQLTYIFQIYIHILFFFQHYLILFHVRLSQHLSLRKYYGRKFNSNFNASRKQVNPSILSQENYQQAYQILKRIESTLLTEKQKPTIHLPQINHLLSIVYNNLGCFYHLAEKSQTAERHFKMSLQLSNEECISDETLLITIINMIILCIKIQNFHDACHHINHSFEFLTTIILHQVSVWNPKIRFFLGDGSTIHLDTIEAILLFYSGVTFQHLGQNENAFSTWTRSFELLQKDQRSPYFVLAKLKLESLKHDKVQQLLKFSIQNDEPSSHASNNFRLLSQRIKRQVNCLNLLKCRLVAKEVRISNKIAIRTSIKI